MPALPPRPDPTSRRCHGVVAGVACVLLLLAAPAAAATVRQPLGEGLTAALQDGRLFLEARPLAGEGLNAFARRLCGDAAAAARVREANGGRGALEAGLRYRLPYEILAADLQVRVVRALFGADRPEPDGWRHQGRAAGGESLWQIAAWFTGKGENFAALRRHNGLVETEVPPGASLVVPRPLLLPAFRALLPPPAAVPAPVVTAAVSAAAPTGPGGPPPLAYDRDEAGEHAVYYLQPGEALYSAVVVRFTGRVHAEDVNALAVEIAQRSGILDVTDIPIGYPVRIPYDLLLPEHLPQGHPRRVEYEAALTASAQFRNRVTAVDLAGITVVLDAGHGGRDVGASMGGIWESLYVYDIMLRAKQLLEAYTAARVVPTTRDGAAFRVEDRDVLGFSRAHAVLTNPPYPIADSKVGVNLRWYLANSVHRGAVRKGGDPEQIVFVSIHADSLHPSLRGAMAYIPDAARTGGAISRDGEAYASRQEVREHAAKRASRRELLRGEGLSRELAGHVIDAFRAQGLAVHPFKPVRETVIRNRRAWVPAVLRYNTIPAKILLEVCNLANAQDRELIQTRVFRQQVAEAIVQGILGYYGRPEAAPGGQVAAKARR